MNYKYISNLLKVDDGDHKPVVKDTKFDEYKNTVADIYLAGGTTLNLVAKAHNKGTATIQRWVNARRDNLKGCNV